jgi:hypothetical protein
MPFLIMQKHDLATKSSKRYAQKNSMLSPPLTETNRFCRLSWRNFLQKILQMIPPLENRCHEESEQYMFNRGWNSVKNLVRSSLVLSTYSMPTIFGSAVCARQAIRLKLSL